MKNDAIFLATVQKGVLAIKDHRQLTHYLRTISGDVQVVIRKPRKDRTNRQNRYYWACLTIMGDSLGYYKDELHEAFKAMFLMDHARKIPVPRSTTSLSTAEFVEYMDRIAHVAAENGIILPAPELFY